VARVVPFARSVVSIPAGTARMGLARFTVLTAAGAATWNVVLIGAGYFLGANWDRVSGWVGAYSDVALVAAAIAAAVYLILRHFRKEDHIC
jgi:membrane protein DedA with SNARE-associated domain